MSAMRKAVIQWTATPRSPVRLSGWHSKIEALWKKTNVSADTNAVNIAKGDAKPHSHQSITERCGNDVIAKVFAQMVERKTQPLEVRSRNTK